MTTTHKFKIGDSVIVCNDLVTVIDKVTDETDGHYIYWFNTPDGYKWELEHSIEKYRENWID